MDEASAKLYDLIHGFLEDQYSEVLEETNDGLMTELLRFLSVKERRRGVSMVKSAVDFPVAHIERRILQIREQKVMLDRDLAALYGVETRVLNQAVRRNKKRFPLDFMFSLTREEIRNISQSVICSEIKHARNVNVFTEQGVAMLSSVLNSDRAIEVNIAIMRVFVRLREMTPAQKELKQKLEEIETQLRGHDEDIQVIFRTIRQLMTPPEKPRKRIGFEVSEPKGRYGKRSRKTEG